LQGSEKPGFLKKAQPGRFFGFFGQAGKIGKIIQKNIKFRIMKEI